MILRQIPYNALMELYLLWDEILREKSYFEATYAVSPELELEEEILEFYRASLQSSLDHSLRSVLLEGKFGDNSG